MRWLLVPRRDIVTPEDALIAEEEFTIDDHWIGPGLFHIVDALWPIGRSEAALFVITSGRRFNQRHLSVFPVKVESSVGIAKRGCTECVVLPFYVPIFEFEANQDLTGSPVNDVAELNGTTDAGGQLGGKVNLIGLN